MSDVRDADVDLVDDEFERLGRRAGAELRLPPPADGSGAVLRMARRRRATVAAVAAGVTVAVVVTGFVVVNARTQDEPAPIATVPPTSAPIAIVPPTPSPVVPATESFVGTWVSTDADGSSRVMQIVATADDELEVTVRGQAAGGACSGAPSTMAGTGRLEADDTLVIAAPELTCDDGTTPAIGDPAEGALADFTLVYDAAADALIDSSRAVWRREGSDEAPIAPPQVPVPVAAVGSATSGGMWPQTTIDEVRAAQDLADAGDPVYAWQLDAGLAADEAPWGADIFARFVEEGLGWEEFAGASFAGFMSVDGGSLYDGVLFVRCLPGEANPLSGLYADAPPEIRACAPTIDELRYETVSITVTQPGRRGPSGIWVVDRWEMRQSEPAPRSAFENLYPDYLDGERRVTQIVPPSDAEVTTLVETFLQARVDGEGAENYLIGEQPASDLVPLMYATSGGDAYLRYEMERVQGPVWPTGWMEYQVRLFAVDGTVVEQHFHVVRQDDLLGLMYGYGEPDAQTTENGESLAVPQSVLGGTVTFTAPPLVPRGDGWIETKTAGGDGRIIIETHHGGTGDACMNGRGPVDAEAVAARIMTDPAFETTGPVPVRIAGTDGLQMDVTFEDENPCNSVWLRRPPPGDPGWTARLYLIDTPEQPASSSDSDWVPEVLAITVIASESDFERVLELATPILESIEYHPDKWGE